MDTSWTGEVVIYWICWTQCSWNFLWTPLFNSSFLGLIPSCTALFLNCHTNSNIKAAKRVNFSCWVFSTIKSFGGLAIKLTNWCGSKNWIFNIFRPQSHPNHKIWVTWQLVNKWREDSCSELHFGRQFTSIFDTHLDKFSFVGSIY